MLPLHHNPQMQAGRMRFHRVLSMLLHLVSSGSPESRTQRHPVISRVWATGPRLPSSRDGGSRTHLLVRPRHAGHRYPTSRYPVRTGGFEPPISWSPTRRDTQASLRSDCSGSYGGRTRLPGLKGRCPQTDRRTSRLSAHFSRSGSGGARIRLSWFSARRYTVSATDPNEKA